MNPNKIKVETLAPERLSPNPWNTNVVSPENQQKLNASIKRFGMFKPIVVREIDGTLEIIGGQHRWEAAVEMKLPEVPVVNLGRITDKKAKEISLVDNGRYGADDTLQLAELLDDIGVWRGRACNIHAVLRKRIRFNLLKCQYIAGRS